MSKYSCKQVILSAVVILSAATATTAGAVNLSVTSKTQEKNQWCWAASSQMILKYYGRHFAEQCEIAELARTRNSARFGTTPACLDPDAGSNQPNFLTGAGSITDLLNYHSIRNNVFSRRLSYAESRSEIDASHPFILRWGWTGGGGHVVVVHGYFNSTTTTPILPDRLYISDPWPGEGRQIRSYNSVVTPPGGSWTHTVTTNGSGSNPITLYQHVDYLGMNMSVTGATSYVGSTFNDRTSSVKVRGVPWIMYQHSNYDGYSWGVTPGDYADFLEWNGVNDTISSVKEMPGWNYYGAIILFEHSYFRGRYKIITGDVSNLGSYGFNDTVSSAIVVGNIWRLYPHSSYSGNHYALTSFGGPRRDGFYPTPADWGGSDNEISSVYWIPESWNPILLYQHVNLKGRAVALTRWDDPAWLNNLSNLGFNDQVSSIKTYGDTWTVYRHHNQTGVAQTLNANTWYRSPADWGGFNDDMTSLRFTDSDNWF